MNTKEEVRERVFYFVSPKLPDYSMEEKIAVAEQFVDWIALDPVRHELRERSLVAVLDAIGEDEWEPEHIIEDLNAYLAWLDS